MLENTKKRLIPQCEITFFYDEKQPEFRRFLLACWLCCATANLPALNNK